MKINLTDFLFAMSYALDAVENEINGARPGHGMRVAFLLMKMIRSLPLSNNQKIAYLHCAILHDNGVAESCRNELDLINEKSSSLINHVKLGEINIKDLNLGVDVTNVILHHHENFDGSGPLGLKADEINPIAQLIQLADIVELSCDFNNYNEDLHHKTIQFVLSLKNKLVSEKSIDLFLKSVTQDDFKFMSQENFAEEFKKQIADISRSYTRDEIFSLAKFFMKIVDYKSSFTKEHSQGVAQKAYLLAEYYGFSQEKAIRFYLAGALHDIGKLLVTNQILEKPGKLDVEEFTKMQAHAQFSYDLLKNIQDFEDICEWSCNHHEKLDGSGYPRGLNKDSLSFEARLMACIDIYQALTEERPYKKGMSPHKAILIMRDMVNSGKIDRDITEDMAKIFIADDEKELGESDPNIKKYRCKICGYVYEGDEPPKVCPICDTSGMFE